MLDYPRALSSSWFSILKANPTAKRWLMSWSTSSFKVVQNRSLPVPKAPGRVMIIMGLVQTKCKRIPKHPPSIWSPYGVFQMISGESNGDFRLQELKCPSPSQPAWSILVLEAALTSEIQSRPGQVRSMTTARLVGQPTWHALPRKRWHHGSWVHGWFLAGNFEGIPCVEQQHMWECVQIIHWYPIGTPFVSICAMVSI